MNLDQMTTLKQNKSIKIPTWKVWSALNRVLEACYFAEKRHWEEHGKPMPDVAHMLYHDLEVLRCWRDGEPMPPDGRCTV